MSPALQYYKLYELQLICSFSVKSATMSEEKVSALGFEPGL